MDEGWTSQHVVEYSLENARSELSRSDTGLDLNVTFETHDHSGTIESKYSKSDLGIVLSVDHPILGSSRRGLLLQAKRLFPSDQLGQYSLYSKYNSFDHNQFRRLIEIDGSISAYGAVAYLWFNPMLSAFENKSHAHLKAFDAFQDQVLRLHSNPVRERIGHLCGSYLDNEESEGTRTYRSLTLAAQPALRVSRVADLKDFPDPSKQPSIQLLWENGTKVNRSRPFFRFSDFIMKHLVGCNGDRQSDAFLDLCSGKPVTLEDLKARGDSKGRSQAGESLTPPAHTIHFKITSTLPRIG
jgi:hypothetical protein